MAAVACPYRPVKQRPSEPHVHAFPIEMATDQRDVVVRDCWCGHRERVRMAGRMVIESLPDAVVDGGALLNVVYVQDTAAHFSDRWTSTNKEI